MNDVQDTNKPAYTIVGTSGKDPEAPPFTVTVYTDDGPENAMALAHEEHGRQRRDQGELQIVAVLAGEARPIDFDDETTWPTGAQS